MEKRIEEIALVTGASSGIGKETAVRLAERGLQVIAAARRLDRLEELAKRHRSIIPKQVDLSDPTDTENFCSYLSELPQPVSILINNAGYATRGVLEDVPLEKIKRVFEVNLFALIRVTQACLPAMRANRSGIIVNVSSIVGKFSFPGSCVYAASKYAVEGITDGLRVELAPFGIRVVAIRPGAIATEFGQVAEQMTGDLLGTTDPDYRPFYQTAKAATEEIWADDPPQPTGHYCRPDCRCRICAATEGRVCRRLQKRSFFGETGRTRRRRIFPIHAGALQPVGAEGLTTPPSDDKAFNLNLTSNWNADSSYILLVREVHARGRVAQLGERRPYKPKVTGSSPVPPTNSLYRRGCGRAPYCR